MRRRLRPGSRAFPLLMLAVVLAGCGRPGTTSTLTDVEAALASTPGKVLHGSVLTDEIVPLDDVTVELLDGGRNATTDARGAYLFAGLESRDYLVRVASPGFYPEVQRAAMGLGRDFSLDFLVERMPTGEPHHTSQAFHAFLSCQALVWLDFPGPLRQDCGAQDPNNQRERVFAFEPNSNGFLLELDWEPTTPCANRLDFGLYLLMDGGPVHPLDERTVRPGTKIHIPPAYFAPRERSGGEVRAIVSVDRCDDIGGAGLSAGLAFQQPVDVIFTAFYFEPIPAEFTAR